MDNGIDRQANVSGVVDDDRCVACADAQSRFTGGVSCLDHAGTTGCQDGVRFTHDLIGQLQVWNVNPADDVFRCTCCHRCFIDHLCRGNGGFLGTRMWADDDSVSCL